MVQSPRVEKGFTVSGISPGLGSVLSILVIAASTNLTRSEFLNVTVAPTPRMIKVQPGASAMSLISLDSCLFGIWPLTCMGVFGVKGGKVRFLGGVFGVARITSRLLSILVSIIAARTE